MEVNVIIRKDVKGLGKQLAKSAKATKKRIQSETTGNLSWIIKYWLESWEILSVELALRYDISKLKNNSDKKQFLMSLVRANCPYVDKEGNICSVNVETIDNVTCKTYSVIESGSFNSNRVYSWFLRVSGKQTIVDTTLVYKSVVEITTKSTEVKTKKIVTENKAA